MSKDFFGGSTAKGFGKRRNGFADNKRAIRVRPALVAQCVDDAISGDDILRTQAYGDNPIASPLW